MTHGFGKKSYHLPVLPAVEGHAQRSAWVSAGWLDWWCWPGMPSPLATASSSLRSEPRPATQDSGVITSALKIEGACHGQTVSLWSSTTHLNQGQVFVLTVPLCSRWRTCAAGAKLPASVGGSPSAPGGPPTTRSVHPSTRRWWPRPSGHSRSSRSPFCSPAPCAAGRCCWFLRQTWWTSPEAPETPKLDITTDTGHSSVNALILIHQPCNKYHLCEAYYSFYSMRQCMISIQLNIFNPMTWKSTMFCHQWGW